MKAGFLKSNYGMASTTNDFVISTLASMPCISMIDFASLDLIQDV